MKKMTIKNSRPLRKAWLATQGIGLAGMILLLGSTSSKAQIIDSFDNASTDFTGNFTSEGVSGGGSWTYSSTAGTGGSGGVTVAGANQAYYDTSSISNLSSGTAYNESISFKAVANTTTGTNTVILLAFQNSTGDIAATSATPTATAGTYIGGRIYDNNGTFQLSFKSYSNSTSNSAPNNTLSFINIPNSANGLGTNLQSGEWYTLNFNLTDSGGTNPFTAVLTLYDIGSTGTSTPTQLETLTSSAFNNATLAANTTGIYATAETGSFLYGGASAIDNFSVQAVPEPSEIGYLIFGGLLFAVFSAYRKRITYA